MVSKNLSVCLWSTLTPIISGLAKLNGQKKNFGHLWQKDMPQNFLIYFSKMYLFDVFDLFDVFYLFLRMLACILFVFGALTEYACLLFSRGTLDEDDEEDEAYLKKQRRKNEGTPPGVKVG